MGLGLAAFGSLAFLGASEVLVRSKVVPYHPFYKYLEVFKTSENPNAIFGDSHFAYGIAGLNDFVNLAYPGNNFEAIAEKVELYFSDKRPGRIILQAGVHHFSQNFLFRRPGESRSIADDLRGDDSLKLHLFHNQHRSHLFSYWDMFLDGRKFAPKTKFVVEAGRIDEPNYMEVNKRIRRIASARIARVLQPVASFRSTPIARLYEKIIRSVRQNGGEVCLVTLPVVDELRAAMNRNPLFAEAATYFSEIADRTGAKYRNYLFTRFDGNYFSDPHHLNIEGALFLSAKVERDCFGIQNRTARP